ncbi:4-(cytidine 5'-diphospho)-2-C-methyl-D-erythritol kinase [Kosmotoga pacifica]|uniref:4-diphosphocytidyl-2-C-methyl-D-erythritol kinase n=1 Tax=Kosmotoga pacifica TaxID=1330330 RepID=A0A0G2ZA79_9BACT|nr:4-(cytidine 5'-diphospho)-2-C-methyl-D-erythritol kinase [Kosmotoga pacifica]AKI96991.1 hypothetical protein IX53_03190 [Kosmotoga pacifica]
MADGRVVKINGKIYPKTLKAFAKVNLHLQVCGLKGNYHEIVTLFQTVSLSDELYIEPSLSPGVKFYSEPKLLWNEENTLYKACESFERLTHQRLSIRITLKKCIPFSGGLGGGSSDAGTLLRALGVLLKIPFRTIYKAACKVGSDVPFFLVGGTAIGLGRGERLIFPGDLEGYKVDLYFPGLGVSTPEAFAMIDKENHNEEQDISKAFELYRALKDGDFSKVASLSSNTFERVILRLEKIAKLYEEISRKKAIFHRLSGSGSTLFSLYEPESRDGNYNFVSSAEVKKLNDF